MVSLGMNNKIYIQIPAYRDNELQPTLYDLIDKSSCKQNLRICVAWQHEKHEKLDFDFIEEHGIELIDIPAHKSQGCNWARALLQERWMDEKYTLLLDSHHRFVSAWDQQLVDMYEGLKCSGIAKPVISGYLPVYDPADDPDARQQVPLKMVFFSRERGLLFRLKSRKIEVCQSMVSPFPAHLISLHFLFAEGTFNEEIEMDPSIYFFADEIAISLRAYTSGFDLFHPHKIIGWHLYNRTGTRIPHWDDHPEWKQQMEYAYNELSQLFTGNKKGNFGTGSNRTVSNYEEYIGMKLIKPGGLTYQLVPSKN
jgi:hypothetical protein